MTTETLIDLFLVLTPIYLVTMIYLMLRLRKAQKRTAQLTEELINLGQMYREVDRELEIRGWDAR